MKMGLSKKNYMHYHSFATLEDVIQKYNLDAEEQMWYETLCDNRLKDTKVKG
jgi:cytochrome c peroxidase|tara:strand:+ start:400 stop:555 length:156 start_codon:yes stop_codon:yes gene_type:complete